MSHFEQGEDLIKDRVWESGRDRVQEGIRLRQGSGAGRNQVEVVWVGVGTG